MSGAEGILYDDEVAAGGTTFLGINWARTAAGEVFDGEHFAGELAGVVGDVPAEPAVADRLEWVATRPSGDGQPWVIPLQRAVTPVHDLHRPNLTFNAACLLVPAIRRDLLLLARKIREAHARGDAVVRVRRGPIPTIDEGATWPPVPPAFDGTRGWREPAA